MVGLPQNSFVFKDYRDIATGLMGGQSLLREGKPIGDLFLNRISGRGNNRRKDRIKNNNKHNMIKAVIFDFDGVIMDSEPLNDIFFPRHLKRMGIDLSADYIKQFKGTSSKTQWSYIIKKYHLTRPINELIAESSRDYLAFIKSIPDIKPITGVRELLALLSQSKVKIALASSASKKRIHTILDMFNITHYFSVITSTHDVEHSKPNPEIFLITAKN